MADKDENKTIIIHAIRSLGGSIILSLIKISNRYRSAHHKFNTESHKDLVDFRSSVCKRSIVQGKGSPTNQRQHRAIKATLVFGITERSHRYALGLMSSKWTDLAETGAVALALACKLNVIPNSSIFGDIVPPNDHSDLYENFIRQLILCLRTMGNTDFETTSTLRLFLVRSLVYSLLFCDKSSRTIVRGVDSILCMFYEEVNERREKTIQSGAILDLLIQSLLAHKHVIMYYLVENDGKLLGLFQGILRAIQFESVQREQRHLSSYLCGNNTSNMISRHLSLLINLLLYIITSTCRDERSEENSKDIIDVSLKQKKMLVIQTVLHCSGLLEELIRYLLLLHQEQSLSECAPNLWSSDKCTIFCSYGDALCIYQIMLCLLQIEAFAPVVEEGPLCRLTKHTHAVSKICIESLLGGFCSIHRLLPSVLFSLWSELVVIQEQTHLQEQLHCERLLLIHKVKFLLVIVLCTLRDNASSRQKHCSKEARLLARPGNGQNGNYNRSVVTNVSQGRRKVSLSGSLSISSSFSKEQQCLETLLLESKLCPLLFWLTVYPDEDIQKNASYILKILDDHFRIKKEDDLWSVSLIEQGCVPILYQLKSCLNNEKNEVSFDLTNTILQDLHQRLFSTSLLFDGLLKTLSSLNVENDSYPVDRFNNIITTIVLVVTSRSYGKESTEDTTPHIMMSLITVVLKKLEGNETTIFVKLFLKLMSYIAEEDLLFISQETTKNNALAAEDKLLAEQRKLHSDNICVPASIVWVRSKDHPVPVKMQCPEKKYVALVSTELVNQLYPSVISEAIMNEKQFPTIFAPTYKAAEEFMAHVVGDTTSNQHHTLDFCFDLLSLASHFNAWQLQQRYSEMCYNRCDSFNLLSVLNRSLDFNCPWLSQTSFLHICKHFDEVIRIHPKKSIKDALHKFFRNKWQL